MKLGLPIDHYGGFLKIVKFEARFLPIDHYGEYLRSVNSLAREAYSLVILPTISMNNVKVEIMIIKKRKKTFINKIMNNTKSLYMKVNLL